jgi:hypothetical protein
MPVLDSRLIPKYTEETPRTQSFTRNKGSSKQLLKLPILEVEVSTKTGVIETEESHLPRNQSWSTDENQSVFSPRELSDPTSQRFYITSQPRLLSDIPIDT